METVIYETLLGDKIEVTFDDLQVEILDRCDHSIFYKCTGYDKVGRIYEATAEFCCGEFEGITDIEMVSYLWHNKKPGRARMLLKSIEFWQKVIAGEIEPKKPMAYYVNKLSWYKPHDIEYLKKQALL